MSTRVVYRGSRGRFAGAASGKAERVRVGRGYIRGSSPSAGNARPKPGRITQMRNKRAAARQANNIKPLNPNVKPRSRPAPASHNHPAGLTKRSKGARIKYAAGRALQTKAGKAVIVTGVGVGVTAIGARALSSGKKNAKISPSGTYRNKGVGRKEGTIVRQGVYRNKGQGRVEDVGFSVKGGSLRDAAKRSAPAGPKVNRPDYNLAKGKKEYVGRRVTDGNYGFILRKK